MLAWNSLIRGKYVANDGLTASNDDTLEHGKHSCSQHITYGIRLAFQIHININRIWEVELACIVFMYFLIALTIKTCTLSSVLVLPTGEVRYSKHKPTAHQSSLVILYYKKWLHLPLWLCVSYLLEPGPLCMWLWPWKYLRHPEHCQLAHRQLHGPLEGTVKTQHWFALLYFLINNSISISPALLCWVLSEDRLIGSWI